MLHSDAIKLLIDYGIDLEFAKNFTIKVGSPNPEIEAFLSNIESIPNYDENSDLNQYINNARELLKESDKLYHQLQTAQRAAHVLQVLADKAKRYSKQTFVDISNINTVSKLRITKFSEFNISENVDVSDEAFALIKEKINNYI
ncbi:hypothetical protein [Furfurilactobacillus cerevisiae]|uniref:hypothetical protein n=1 Tax=Furfurilactobacillus rossiae TaxID=231049 RepID=UPI003B980015